MNILIACEESGRVTEEFRKKGHNTFSCDILKTSGNHPEYHIRKDVLQIINGRCDFETEDGQDYHIVRNWDMIIAFPPCTHLAVSGARHFEKKREDGTKTTFSADYGFCKSGSERSKTYLGVAKAMAEQWG